MKSSFRFMLLLTICLCCSVQTDARRRSVTLRLSTYNIHHAEGLDGRIDHPRIGWLLKSSRAQVVAVQEVDSATRRSGGKYDLDEIGRTARMHASFAPAIAFQGGKYGIGLLSRKKPLSLRQIPLPGREEKRTLLVAEFRDYVVASTHLSLTEADRLASIPLIVAEASRWKKPFLLAGDFNDEPGSAFYRSMQEHFIFLNSPNEHTFPADSPTVCIDHIALFRSPLLTLDYHHTWVEEESVASDHRPLHAHIGIFNAKTPK